MVIFYNHYGVNNKHLPIWSHFIFIYVMETVDKLTWSIRIEAGLKAKLVEIAKLEKRSLNNLIEIALEKFAGSYPFSKEAKKDTKGLNRKL